MPYYAALRREEPATRKRIASGLLRLRQALVDQKVPSRTVAGNVLIASWNIREFDSRKFGGRSKEAFYYIAEILSHFDLIAIQEVRSDLSALEEVQKLLGSWWKYIVTDVTDKALGGNDERMAFLYDSRKVTFGGLAGEIVLPPSKVDPTVLQFARTPFICGFRSGWAKIDLCTVHIFYGNDEPLDPRRLAEIRNLANFLAKRAKKAAQPEPSPAPTTTIRPPEPDTLILLGDFNIFDTTDATLKAITDAGFAIPKVLTERGKGDGSNMVRDKFYDQIAIWRGKRFGETPRGGVFDFYKAVFRDEDEATYASQIKPAKSGKPPKYKEWKTYQMSDHLVLWSAFKVDFAEDYLSDLAKDVQG
ncbi:endonuclease/exonuclease/phosphatase family protein [Agrobacterium rhizogenes]|nr:endonuclease/exonuclease/phosphatase family protein [Rhizobium rhizogenes]NTJ77804.1 endonuclease/exonuclease/phosphatase family protein [Rhizobium rhizogenes]